MQPNQIQPPTNPGQPLQAPTAPQSFNPGLQQPIQPAQPAMAQAPAMQPTAQPAQTPQAAAARSARRDNPSSTQHALIFSELRDSMVIMKDGSFRAVVACKSINFDLMSESERESVEYSYQNFLNSLDFSIQVLVRSQRVDIAPYIDRLMDLRRKNENMLLGVLMDDYINFIDILSQEANIMDKSFFIIIPYYSSKEAEKALEQSKNFFKSFTKDKTPPVTRIDRTVYDKAITEINNRVETVISGLFQLGVQAVRLNTQELSQLYYNFNNPGEAVREPLGDFSKIAQLYVRKAEPGEEI